MRRRLAKGALWIGASRTLVNLIAFGNTLVLARLLMPADFGLVSIALTVSAVIVSLTELSLSQALIHHANPGDDEYHSAWTMNAIRAGLLMLATFAIAAPVAKLYGDQRLVSVMMVIGLGTFATGLANPKLVAFSRGLVFWQESMVSLTQNLVSFGVAIAVALTFRSYWALVVGLVIGQIWATIFTYLLVPYRPCIRLKGGRNLLSFSLWLSLAQAVNTLNWRFDHLVIGYFLGNVPLGYYSVGDNLAASPTRAAITPVAQTLFPAMARLTGDVQHLRQAYQRAQSLMFAVALPLGCGFAIVAEPLVLLTMGEKWSHAITIIQLLAAIFALQTLSSAVQPLAMAMGQTRMLFNRDLLNFLIRLPLIIVGLWAGGLAGIVVARCVSGVIGTFINMEMARRLLSLSIWRQFSINSRALIATVVMVSGAVAINQLFLAPAPPSYWVQAVVLVSAGAVLYLGTTFLLWWCLGRPAGPDKEVIDFVIDVWRSGSALR
jgi:O-antigen/teichoic acid export membrane protein